MTDKTFVIVISWERNISATDCIRKQESSGENAWRYGLITLHVEKPMEVVHDVLKRLDLQLNEDKTQVVLSFLVLQLLKEPHQFRTRSDAEVILHL